MSSILHFREERQRTETIIEAISTKKNLKPMDGTQPIVQVPTEQPRSVTDADHQGGNSTSTISMRTVILATQFVILYAVYAYIDPFNSRKRHETGGGRPPLSEDSDNQLAPQGPSSAPRAPLIVVTVVNDNDSEAPTLPMSRPTPTSVKQTQGPAPPLPAKLKVNNSNGGNTDGRQSPVVGFEMQVYEGTIKKISKDLLVKTINPDLPLSTQYAPPYVGEPVYRKVNWTRRAPSKAANMNNDTEAVTTSAPTDDASFGPPPRLLLTEAFSGKYGLNNILISAASMLMYGAMDERAVHFPSNSPVRMESLLDLEATETLLRPLNVVIISDREYDVLYGNASGVRARRNGISFGYRTSAGSPERSVSGAALMFQRSGMSKSRRFPIFTHRDFFLSFPSRAAAPLDICFFIKRLVYHRNVRSMASQLLTMLQNKGVNRYLAFHLRLEIDAPLVKRIANQVQPEELERFIREDIMERLVKPAGIDAVYICAGKLLDPMMRVLKEVKYDVPIYLKTDFPDIKVPMVDEKTVVTSHVGAGVDALMMKHATIAVALGASTFGFGTLATRCPSPVRTATGPTANMRSAVSQFTWQAGGKSNMVHPSPADVKLMAEQASELSLSVPRPAFEAIYFYDYNAQAKFTKMIYQPCEEAFQWCFFKD